MAWLTPPTGFVFGAGAGASAGTSPAKEQPQRSPRVGPLTQTRSPAGSPSQQLPEFGRLRLDSAPSSPQASPRPQPLGAAATATQQRGSQPDRPACTPQGSQGSQLVTSLWRWQQRQQQQASDSPEPLQAPASGEEDWVIPASPDICCNQEGAAAAPALIPVSPSCAWQRQQHSQSQQGQPVEPEAAAAAAPLVRAPAAPAASAAGFVAAAAPPSPFRSSQERREEIAILSEMAQDGADGWSSQEGEVPLPPAQGQPQQEAQAQWQFPSPGGPGSSGAAAAAPSAGRAYSGGQQGGARYVCSLTSQEASELSDPWSQPEDEAEEQRRQQQCKRPL